MPIYVNGNSQGMLIETCAGLLDDDSPEDCIRKEAIEETGYQVGEVAKLFELYMSPGGVTEIIHFFAAEYDDTTRHNEGAGSRTKISKCWKYLSGRRWRWSDAARLKTVKP